MRGATVVYKLKPIFELPRDLDLPRNMYEMKNPVACVTRTEREHTEGETGDVLTSITDKVKLILKKPIPELAVLESRWDLVLQQLADLKSQMAAIKKTVGDVCKVSGRAVLDTSTLNNLKVFQGAVINANPDAPPYSLLFLKYIYNSSLPISFSAHIHSTVMCLSNDVKYFNEPPTSFTGGLRFVVIWKNGVQDAELVLNPDKQIPIRGEVNILRYLARSGLNLLKYPPGDLLEVIHVDSILDLSHKLMHVRTTREKMSVLKSLNGKLGKSTYFGGEEMNICDFCTYSGVRQSSVNVSQDLPPNLSKWYAKMHKILF